MTDPIQILRSLLVAMLEDMLREAEEHLDARKAQFQHDAFHARSRDAGALRRVIEIMGREGK